MKAFEMVRRNDESGVSGTGKVLEGIVFDDGTTVIRWCVDHVANSTAIYPRFEDFKRIHIDSHPTNGTEINFHVSTKVRKRMKRIGKSVHNPIGKNLHRFALKHLHRFVSNDIHRSANEIHRSAVKNVHRFTRVMA